MKLLIRLNFKVGERIIVAVIMVNTLKIDFSAYTFSNSYMCSNDSFLGAAFLIVPK